MSATTETFHGHSVKITARSVPKAEVPRDEHFAYAVLTCILFAYVIFRKTVTWEQDGSADARGDR